MLGTKPILNMGFMRIMVSEYKPKDKKCRVCKMSFLAGSSTQVVCSLACSVSYVNEKAAKQRRKENSLDRQRIKTKTQHLREAQTVFNRYIRLRDAGKPCISCDKPDDGTHQRHASHYRSVSAASQLRFDEANVSASCMQCNSHRSGNVVEYRIRLANKIGQDEVERLESSHEVVKWDIDEIVVLKQRYREKIKELTISN